MRNPYAARVRFLRAVTEELALDSRPTLAVESGSDTRNENDGKVCAICGLVGAHYAICPASDDYYSPERERSDAEWSEFYPERPEPEIDPD